MNWRSTVVTALLSSFGLWLYGGDLIRWTLISRAPFAVAAGYPSLVFGGLGAALALASWGALVLDLVRRRAPSPAHRFARASMVALLAFDFGVRSTVWSEGTAEDALLAAVHTVAREAAEASTGEMVTSDPTVVHGWLEQLGPVPLFEHGVRVADWKIEVRERCGGPATEPGSALPGTLIYCVSDDRHRAWVSLVAAKEGDRFGPVAVVGAESPWVAEIDAEPPLEDALDDGAEPDPQ